MMNAPLPMKKETMGLSPTLHGLDADAVDQPRALPVGRGAICQSQVQPMTSGLVEFASSQRPGSIRSHWSSALDDFLAGLRVLPLGVDRVGVGVVHRVVGAAGQRADAVLDEGEAVEPAARVAHLRQPGPHLVGRCVDRAGVGPVDLRCRKQLVAGQRLGRLGRRGAPGGHPGHEDGESDDERDGQDDQAAHNPEQTSAQSHAILAWV